MAPIIHHEIVRLPPDVRYPISPKLPVRQLQPYVRQALTVENWLRKFAQSKLSGPGFNPPLEERAGKLDGSLMVLLTVLYVVGFGGFAYRGSWLCELGCGPTTRTVARVSVT
jgi:hypothetical protein